MNTSACRDAGKKRAIPRLIVWVGLLVVAWSWPATAQIAPTGAHYAGRASDTGHAGPNDQGSYATSIALNLPEARGGLPIPIEILSGTRGFGAVGVGWDIPLSYVFVDNSYAHRRPAMAPGISPTPRDRISVSLLGRNVEMLPQGDGWIGRSATDLSMRSDGTTWTIVDGNGIIYTFVQDPLLEGTGGWFEQSGGLWLLHSIKGRAGAEVTLTYEIAATVVPGPSIVSQVMSIDLSRVDYNPDPSGICFKHEIQLEYNTVASNAAPQSLSVVGEVTIARFHSLGDVSVVSRASCVDSPQRVHHYHFTYADDLDTQQPRLAAVTEAGRDAPDSTTPLPVVSYKYGSATTTSSGKQVLRYALTPQAIQLPSGASAFIADTAKLGTSVFTPPVTGTVGYGMTQTVTDFNGDGRPDVVFTSSTGQLSIAPGISGMNIGPTAPLNDATFTRPVLDARSSSVVRFSDEASYQIKVDYVWTQSIDTNGDGRVDIIDAAEKPNTWVVYLNTPDPSAPSGIKWVRRAYDVTQLEQRLNEHGLARNLGGYLPLSIRVTGRNHGQWTCWALVDGHYETTLLSDCPAPSVDATIGTEQTSVEYEVTDINGDGYPDVVFNSSATDYVDTSGPPGPGGQPHVLTQQQVNLQAVDADNRVEVAYNVRGMFVGVDADLTDPFAYPEELLASNCGVETWKADDSSDDRVQAEQCGFADVNGDGLSDRIENDTATLGTGYSFGTVTLTIPLGAAHRFFGFQDSGFVDKCLTTGPSPSDATQTVGLRDLTGDGIPDLIEQKTTGGYEVFIGTGAGFADTAVDVEGTFLFSHVDEWCDGSTSNTASGLFDIDGDGRPDVLQINGGAINVYQLAGGSQPGTPEAGQIVSVDNGYGSVTSLTYTSAKNDTTTAHQVPFPEIVVSSSQTSGTLGLGGTLATTYYAYGDIALFYDSTADSFRTSGYKRRVEMVNLPGLDATGKSQARATIIDRYALDPANPGTFQFLTEQQRLGRYLQAGMVSDVTTLVGSFSDAWSLLADDLTTDTRRIAGAHTTVDTTDTHLFTDTTAPTDDLCEELMYPYDFDLSVASNDGDYNPCSARGFLYTRSTQSWRGTAAPPSTANVQIYTSVLSVDDYGRVTSMFYQNDASQTDDDVCVDTTYATPTNPSTHVLSAIASRKSWACGPKGDNTTRAEESWEYDKQVPGLVFQGLPTSHTVYRHATDTGQWLSTIREFDADYDALGNPINVTTTREGVSRTTQISYDPFGLTPLSTTVTSGGLAPLVALQAIDPVTNHVVGRTDENGTVRGTTFDGYGRPILQTIATPDNAAVGVLAARSYLGFAGGDPVGRRVLVEKFPDPVPQNKVGTGLGRVSIGYLDELGRSRYVQSALGGDYANDQLITESRTYDSLGRITFEADAYPSSQAAASAYGTTRYFNADGSLWLEIRGNGPQPATTSSNASTELFPSLYQHAFANHLESMTVQAADSLTAGSPQFGVVAQATTTAVGRVLSRTTTRNGATIESEALGYELFGRQTNLTRYQDPSGDNSPVSTTWKFDSVGQVLEIDEPTSSPQKRTYSDWGELENVTWTPPLPELAHNTFNTYDGYGRLTRSYEQNGGVYDDATDKEYSYDRSWTTTLVNGTYSTGRLTVAVTPTETVGFSYDSYGNVNQRQFDDDDGNSYVDRQLFHGDGSQESIELDLPDNDYQAEQVTYKYDTAGRVRSMWFNGGRGEQELYSANTVDDWGRVLETSLGVTTVASTFATAGRRLPKTSKATSPMGSRVINFDQFDAMSRETIRDEVTPNSPGRTTTSYDALGRVQSSIRAFGSSTTAKWSFTYDPLGNASSLADPVSGNRAFLSYLTTDRDEICGVGYTSAPTSCNVMHDHFGNVTTEPTRTGYNQLAYLNSGDLRTVVNQSGAQATFSYDSFGKVQDVSITGPTGSRHDQDFGEFITNRSQTGNGSSASYISRHFPGPGVSIGQRGLGGSWVYEVSESSGTRFTIDDKGAFLQDLSYSPFGIAKSTGVSPGTSTFTTSQWNDGDALEGFGLVHVGARVYDPAIGRFLSRDGLLTSRTAARSNPYAFAINDPVNLSDPTGLDPCAGNITCIWTSVNGGADSGSIASAVALGLYAANFLSTTGTELPTTGLSREQILAYGSSFGAQTAQLQMYGVMNHFTHPGGGGGFGDLVSGFADGLYDAGAGLYHMGRHPIATIMGLEHALEHPWATTKAIGRSIRSTGSAIMSGDMHALGHAVADVALALGPGAAEKALGELAEVETIAAIDEGSTASASAGDQILYHGTDAESASDIVTNKLSVERANELGGGDVFWASSKKADAEFYGAANPSGGPSAIVRISVPKPVIKTLVNAGHLVIEGTDYKFLVGRGWDHLSKFAHFSLEP